MNRLSVASVVGVTLFVVALGLAHADVPNLVPVQGYLTDSNGVAVDGNQSLTFSVYTTDMGGTPLHSETQNLALDKGVFSTVLGRTATLDLSLFENNSQLYLGVAVGSTKELAPRFRLASSPYSASAQYAARAASADNGVPPGSILAYGGSTPPAGWLLCDGAPYDGDDPRYKSLYQAIGESWGDGGDLSGHKFNVPDLGGRFLRGVDKGKIPRDPDSGSRTSEMNGNQGNQVGSVQSHAVEQHSHQATQNVIVQEGGDYAVGGYTPGGASFLVTTKGSIIQPTGGHENRPVNAYVNYIIKY